MIKQDLVDFAVDATRRAGHLTLDWYQSRGLSVTAKRDGSPVTEADYAAVAAALIVYEARRQRGAQADSDSAEEQP